MINFIISAIKIIFLLGFLILIHEAGHLIIAKLCKVKVNEFSIGFGKKLWQKQGKETKYTLRLIPLGGYCSMEGEEERSEAEGSFSKASIPKRIAIVIAGATVNIVFGIIVYFILMSSTGTYVTNEIDSVLEGYSAQTIGLQSGDKIIEMIGKKVNSKYDLDNITENVDGNQEVNIKIERDGKSLEYNTKLTEIKQKTTGIYLSEDAKIVTIEKDSPAERSGLKSNDKILQVNGIEINGDVNKILSAIQETSDDNIQLEIERGNQKIDVTLVPDYVPIYYLGVNLKQADSTFLNHIIYGGVETKTFLFSIVDNIKQLFTGNVGLDQMMGPVGISEAVAKTNGWQEFIYMLALISLSLGITNLLPIPALDGGKILILLIEAIRRKPLKQETEINIQMLGFTLLVALALYVSYNDILRLF